MDIMFLILKIERNLKFESSVSNYVSLFVTFFKIYLNRLKDDPKILNSKM